MAIYKCDVCDHLYDEASEGTPFADLPDDWECPVCGASKAYFNKVEETPEGESAEPEPFAPDKSAADFRRTSDEQERYMADIHAMAETGRSVIEPMRTSKPVVGWDDIVILGAQLATLPVEATVAVNMQTVIGPRAAHPLVIETPIYVSHMSFGALSKEVKIAMAKGSAMAKTAMCSGEGGIIPESLANAYKYIFEYVPNQYSVTDENLRKVDAVEIKFGQSTKPGMGGHLPGAKVTGEIAEVRGKPEGEDIISPSGFADIRTPADLKDKIDWLREKTGGKPVGVKIAAGHIEADLQVIIQAGVDFVTIDGRPGGTGASPKYIKAATSLPTVYALYRARKFLDEHDAADVSLVVTGGLRTSGDFAKAFAMGADAVAIATAAMMACGCQQYRVCHKGTCPVGIATQDSGLRERLNIEKSSQGLANYLKVCTMELQDFARLTGHTNVHEMSVTDLCTTSSEISDHTSIRHA